MNNKALVVAALAALAAAPASAGYIGSIGFPMKHGANALELTYDTGAREVEGDGGSEDDLESNRLVIQYGRGIGNGLEVFGRFSPSGEAEFDEGGGDFDVIGFGGGIRWSPKQAGKVKFGAQVSLDLNQGDDGDVDIDYKEIMLAGAGSYRVNKNVDTYGGISLLKLDGSVEQAGTDFDFENSNSFGIFGGLDLKPSPNFTVGVELRLVNESMFSLSGRFKF